MMADKALLRRLQLGLGASLSRFSILSRIHTLYLLSEFCSVRRSRWRRVLSQALSHTKRFAPAAFVSATAHQKARQASPPFICSSRVAGSLSTLLSSAPCFLNSVKLPPTAQVVHSNGPNSRRGCLRYPIFDVVPPPFLSSSLILKVATTK